AFTTLFSGGAPSEAAAQSRYERIMEQNPANIACVLNILTVMQDIDLPELTPLDYLREIVWGETMARDRFFAWADRTLVEQVRIATEQGAFLQQASPGLLHPGATSSYKQIQVGEANLQLTFHERASNGQDRLKVELDMDYFRDPVAHTLLEVIPGLFELTDPKRIYELRWIAGH